MDRKNH